MKKNYILLAIFTVMLALAVPTIGQGAGLQWISGEFAINGVVSAALGTDTSSDSFGPFSETHVDRSTSVNLSDPCGNFSSASISVSA